jgi:superfamily II DNA or RNA helicase
MNTSLNRFGYKINKNDLTAEELEKIRKKLTVAPEENKAYKFGKATDKSFALYKENDLYISVPRFFGIDRFGPAKNNLLYDYDYPTYDMQYLLSLRPNQMFIHDVIKKIETGGGGLVVAGCGIGKTNLAIYVACHFKLKTLFVVHKEFLRDQFTKRVIECTNVDSVGLIQGSTVKISYPFVVGMIQSLCADKYNNKIFKDFGLIIFDEVHHMGAKCYSKFFGLAASKYMLGITAENNRNDGLYKIMNMYMGPILHFEDQKPNNMVIIKKINYTTSNSKMMEIVINKYTKEPDRSTMISNLVKIKKRNRLILNIVKILFSMGKKILCLTARLHQVHILQTLFSRDPLLCNEWGTYVGGMKKDALAESAKAKIIIGTYAMAEEGLDIDELDSLIFCTPKTKVRQSIGRILRKNVYIVNPLVIDIIDTMSYIYVTQSRERTKYYFSKEYNTQKVDITDIKDYNKVHSGTPAIMWNDIDLIKTFLTKPIDNVNMKSRCKLKEINSTKNKFADVIDF